MPWMLPVDGRKAGGSAVLQPVLAANGISHVAPSAWMQGSSSSWPSVTASVVAVGLGDSQGGLVERGPPPSSPPSPRAHHATCPCWRGSRPPAPYGRRPPLSVVRQVLGDRVAEVVDDLVHAALAVDDVLRQFVVVDLGVEPDGRVQPRRPSWPAAAALRIAARRYRKPVHASERRARASVGRSASCLRRGQQPAPACGPRHGSPTTVVAGERRSRRSLVGDQVRTSAESR